MVKIRKISLYTGKGLTKWLEFETKEKAIEFIKCNLSISGAFYWISKNA